MQRSRVALDGRHLTTLMRDGGRREPVWPGETGRGVRMIFRKTHEMVGGGDLGGGLARQLDTGNAILSVRTQIADYTLDPDRLSVLCAWQGRQEIAMEGRRIHVDDDCWLAVPGPANVRIRSQREVQALTI